MTKLVTWAKQKRTDCQFRGDCFLLRLENNKHNHEISEFAYDKSKEERVKKSLIEQQRLAAMASQEGGNREFKDIFNQFNIEFPTAREQLKGYTIINFVISIKKKRESKNSNNPQRKKEGSTVMIHHPSKKGECLLLLVIMLLIPLVLVVLLLFIAKCLQVMMLLLIIIGFRHTLTGMLKDYFKGF